MKPEIIPDSKPVIVKEKTLTELYDEVKAKCSRIIAYQLSKTETENPSTGETVTTYRFRGKDGFNPYLYIDQVVLPLQAKIVNDELTAKEANDFLANVDEKTPPDSEHVNVPVISVRSKINAEIKAKAAAGK